MDYVSSLRQTITIEWVDQARARRDAVRLTEAVLWCWGSSDTAAVAEFEQVLQVFGGHAIDITDPRHVHRSTLNMLTAGAGSEPAADGDMADLAVDPSAVVFDVIAQWCRYVLASISTEHT